jgi:predicted dehydrogenase
MQASAVAGTALSLTASSYAKVLGANGKINVGFIGVGGRCQQHVDVILKMKEQGKNVEPYAACDVWDGDPTKGKGKGQGLYPTAKRCGIPEGDKARVSKDFRVILDNKEIDVVAIATPDHWHARQSIDAMNAGKHVYCEKPMTKTIAEAQAVVEAWKKSGMVMSVGVQSMADPIWGQANDLIKKGKIGHVLQAQTRYFRNYDGGQWRYYTLTKDMNPKTVDWDMFLGHKFDVNGEKLGPTPAEQPFDRSVFAQWRCYWPFGGGMFTDLFVHQVTHLIAAMGVRYPRRVVGGGGIYMEYDTRDVPDVATIIADYDEGCQMLVTATMCNDYPIDECIRGKTGTIKFIPQAGDLMKGYEFLPQTTGVARGPGDGANVKGEFVANAADAKTDLTYNLWENFLEHVKAKKQGTLSTPELGAAAFTTVNMGVKSYREGKALFWDKEQRKPVEADASWAAAWEKRSKERGKPNQIIGWEAGDAGSTIKPPPYMNLGGPWTDGKDPAGE